MKLNRTETIVQWLLWMMGGVVCLALLPVFFPAPWIRFLHGELGMGEVPDQPVFWFLARSLSLVYFAHGVMVLAVASDVRRYWPLVRWLALLNIVLGLLLLGIDLSAPMPWFWTAAEGPGIVAGGVLLLILHRQGNNRD